MRVLGIGDVIGKPGRDAVRALLPELVRTERIDAVVVNAENSAGGIGTTPETADDLLRAGAAVLTGGNHTWKYREYLAPLERDARLLRPMNLPAGTPGRGFTIVAADAATGRPAFAVVNLIGRVYMEAVDNPFAVVERALEAIAAAGVRVVLVDMHAEASSEKRAMGFHLDGRVSAVWGTHTHVPTADEEILPRGTGYVTDLGMTGPYASVIGLEPEPSVRKFVMNRPTPYRVAEGNIQLRGLLVDVDDATGRAREVRRVERIYRQPAGGAVR